MSRKTILFVLLAATLIYRGSFFFEIFARNSIYPGIQWSVEDGTLVAKKVEATDPFGRPTAAGWAHLKKEDRIVEIRDANGISFPIRSLNDFGNAIRKVRDVGSPTFVVLRKNSSGTEDRLQLAVKPGLKGESDFTASFMTILWTSLLPLVAIVTAFFIGFSKPEDDHAFLACLLFITFSCIITIDIYLLPSGVREFSRLYESTCTIFLPYFFMRFFLLFPSPSSIEQKHPWIKTLFLVLTLIVLGIRLFSDFTLLTSFDRYTKAQSFLSPLRHFSNYEFSTMLGIGMTSLFMNTFRPQSLDERRKMYILLAGVALGVIVPTALVIYLFQTNSNSVFLISAIALCITAFPAAFAYVVIRHRVLGIQFILRRGLQYVLISRAFWVFETTLVFLLLYFLAMPVPAGFIPITSPFLRILFVGALTLLVFYGIRRINQPIMERIDKRFFRQAYNAREILTELSRAVTRFAANPAQLLELVTDRISRSLHPNLVAIFLKGYDIAEDDEGKVRLFAMKDDSYFCVWIQKDSQPPMSSECAFPKNAFVLQQIEKLKEPEAMEIYLDDSKSWAHALAKADENETQMIKERELLEELRANLLLPLTAGGQSIGFFSLGEKLSEEPYSKEDKALLLTVADQTALALHYSKLISEVAEQEKTKREIEIARQVQAHLFPQTLPHVSNLDYIGYCQAARGVGGDYYDFLSLRNNLLGIGLGDISGKGISASLLMATLQALLRSNAPEKGNAVDQLFLTMNGLMCNSTAKGKYATFFYGVFDSDRRTLNYVNAGHLPPMLFRETGEVLRLKTGGMVLGMLPDAKYMKEEIQLKKGDVLVIYSDGVSEAMNIRSEEFGEERLKELIAPNLQKSATEIKDLILAGIEEFVAHAEQHDDLTLVVARFI
jgi:sigma-B regulation protein RsbU (phosphoserine phosphatase)